MAVRKSPFREWVVVYHDPQKTDLKKIEARLREQGCPKARLDAARPTKASGITLAIDNPFVTPGDRVVVAVILPKGRSGKIELVPPREWKMKAGPPRVLKSATKKKPAIVGLQTPRNAPLGKHSFKARVTTAGKVYTLALEVELVKKVG